jgi:hypothetical protein
VHAVTDLRVEFCGELYDLDPARPFLIGRDGDLQVDDNPYLHRHFLRIEHADGMWWLANVGAQLSATVIEQDRGVHAWVGPQARLPLVFQEVAVLFSAGPTTYEVRILAADPVYARVEPANPDAGETTIAPLTFTASQKLLIVALAEPLLRRDGTGSSALPASQEAAQRLGWPITTFNRKLDNVCDKLARTGVRGLRGGPGHLATNRRARLVEHAVSTGLVTKADLALLPSPDRAPALAAAGDIR